MKNVDLKPIHFSAGDEVTMVGSVGTKIYTVEEYVSQWAVRLSVDDNGRKVFVDRIDVSSIYPAKN